jgi:hypothetical protein
MRPAVPSLTGALAAIDAWVREHRFDELHDADGQVWHLQTDVTQIPDKADARKLLWQIQLRLSAAVTAADLIRTHTLHPRDDARLLGLVADSEVPLTVRPQTHVVSSEDEAKLLLSEALPRLKSELESKSLVAVKRELVGRWIDARGRFALETY